MSVCLEPSEGRGRGEGTPEYDRMGKNQNPQKIPTKPRELPGPKFNQQKNPVPSHKNFQEALNDITIIKLQIVLNTQNNPYFNQAAKKNTCQNFPTKTNPEIENFKPEKIF